MNSLTLTQSKKLSQKQPELSLETKATLQAQAVGQALELIGQGLLELSKVLKSPGGLPPGEACTLNPPGLPNTPAGILTNRPGEVLGTGFLRQSSYGQARPAGAVSGVTVTELINDFLYAKARVGRSDRYLRQLRVTLCSFRKGRADLPIENVTVEDFEAWLDKQNWSPVTARGYLVAVRTMYNFAIRRGYLERNLANCVESPQADHNSTIKVHTPAEASGLLQYARKADKDVMRHLALRYFAGLRSAEAFRLREEDLKLDQDLIEVPALKSKTRSRRLVTVQPNLKAWLDLGGELRSLDPMAVRAVIRGSKTPWPSNVTRHSFVSYHLARFGNAGKTALEAGHSEQMTFKHYRAIVTPAAALEYWQVFPK